MITITGTVKKFKNMFELIMCGSKYPLFSDVILEIDGNKIIVNSIDQIGAVATNQEHLGFEIDGDSNIPIDTVSISEAIKLFDDNDTLSFIYENDRIILSTNSENKKDTITIPTSSLSETKIQHIISYDNNVVTIRDNEVKYDASGIINVSNIQDQIRKANYVNNLYHEYIIRIENNKLILSVGDITNFEISSSSEIEIDGKGIAESKYMHGYDDIFKTLSGEINIKMTDNNPIFINKNSDNSIVNYLMSPTISE